MLAEKKFLMEKLKESGIKTNIYTSLKQLKNCNETHVGAVLRKKESFSRSGSRKKYTDEEGRRKQRKRLFERKTVLEVTIADSREDTVEDILSTFLTKIGKGFAENQNWIDLEIGDVEWMDEGDSILKSKVTVGFEVTFTGGVYVDSELKKVRIGTINAKEQEDAYGSNREEK